MFVSYGMKSSLPFFQIFTCKFSYGMAAILDLTFISIISVAACLRDPTQTVCADTQYKST